jgi:hypothetical protein
VLTATAVGDAQPVIDVPATGAQPPHRHHPAARADHFSHPARGPIGKHYMILAHTTATRGATGRATPGRSSQLQVARTNGLLPEEFPNRLLEERRDEGPLLSLIALDDRCPR